MRYEQEFMKYLFYVFRDLSFLNCGNENVQDAKANPESFLERILKFPLMRQIWESWKYLMENNIKPCCEFPWITSSDILDDFDEPVVSCNSCMLTGFCPAGDDCTSVHHKLSLRMQNKEYAPITEEELNEMNPFEEKELQQLIENQIWQSIDERWGELRREQQVLDFEMEHQERQQQQPEWQQQQQQAEPQQQQQLVEPQQQQQQASANPPKEDVSSEESSSDSDSDSTSESESSDDLFEKSTDQRGQPNASVLITPPLSNESVVNNGQTFYEVKKTGEQKDKTISCEQIIRTKFTNFCLNDHSYYQNQPHNLECLGIQTPSESGPLMLHFHKDLDSSSLSSRLPRTENPRPSCSCQNPQQSEEDEEIDVVTCRGLPVSQRGALSGAFQRSNKRMRQSAARANMSDEQFTPRRGRGRPPKNLDQNQIANRKRRAAHLNEQQQQRQEPSAKRSRKRHADASVNIIDHNKRQHHNVMEKQRRVDLRNHFEVLRKQIPATAAKERSPKVLILNEAKNYCHFLKTEMRALELATAKYKAQKRNSITRTLRSITQKFEASR